MLSRINNLAGAGAFAIAMAASNVSFAQDLAAAEGLFKAGTEALQRKDYATACPKLAESYRIDPANGTLYNLALCEDGWGRIATAWARWTELKAKLPPDSPRLAEVEGRIAALAPKVPRVTLTLANGAPADLAIEREGQPVGRATLGTPLPIDPGTHRFVTRLGAAERTHELTIREGESKTLTLEKPVAAAEPTATSTPKVDTVNTAPPPPRDSGGSGQKIAGFAALGIGAVGLGVGAVTGLLALGKKATVEEHCDAGSPVCRNQAGVDASNAGATLATLSTVGFAVGAVGIGAGITLLATAPGSAPKGATLSLRGRF